jgi:LysM repeat protein
VALLRSIFQGVSRAKRRGGALLVAAACTLSPVGATAAGHAKKPANVAGLGHGKKSKPDGRAEKAKSRKHTSSATAAKARRTPARAKVPTSSSAVTMKEIPPDLRALGPLSVGHPAAGYLINSVPMPRSEHWVLTAPDHGFATAETVDALSHCLTRVHERFPSADPTRLGSISAVRGGRISPHKSHRTGRDADVYFFRKPGARWSRAATEQDIDLEPTWALLRCFIVESDVDMILIDRKVQGWLEAYALKSGEPKAWVKSLFHDQREPRQMAVVRHEPGHVAHMHVRFSSPKARRAAAAAYDRLVAAAVVIPPQQAVTHRVKSGETLSGIARKFGVPVERIVELNRLESSLIRVGQELTLQRSVDILGAREGVAVPSRRRPPTDADASPTPALQVATLTTGNNNTPSEPDHTATDWARSHVASPGPRAPAADSLPMPPERATQALPTAKKVDEPAP